MNETIENTKSVLYPKRKISKNLVMKPVKSKKFSQQISMIKTRTVKRRSSQRLKQELVKKVYTGDQKNHTYIQKLLQPVLKQENSEVQEIKVVYEGKQNLQGDSFMTKSGRGNCDFIVSGSGRSWSPSPSSGWKSNDLKFFIEPVENIQGDKEPRGEKGVNLKCKRNFFDGQRSAKEIGDKSDSETVPTDSKDYVTSYCKKCNNLISIGKVFITF